MLWLCLTALFLTLALLGNLYIRYLIRTDGFGFSMPIRVLVGYATLASLTLGVVCGIVWLYKHVSIGVH